MLWRYSSYLRWRYWLYIRRGTKKSGAARNEMDDSDCHSIACIFMPRSSRSLSFFYMFVDIWNFICPELNAFKYLVELSKFDRNEIRTSTKRREKEFMEGNGALNESPWGHKSLPIFIEAPMYRRQALPSLYLRLIYTITHVQNIIYTTLSRLVWLTAYTSFKARANYYHFFFFYFLFPQFFTFLAENFWTFHSITQKSRFTLR